MQHIIYLPDDTYAALAAEARDNETMEGVIRRLLLNLPVPPVAQLFAEPDQAKPRKSRSITVEQWKEHIEIVLSYRDGETHIGTHAWTMAIHNNFIKGEPAFGAKGANASEAMLQVIKEHSPDKYDNAVKGLKETIRLAQAGGAKLKKVSKMIERVTGEAF